MKRCFHCGIRMTASGLSCPECRAVQRWLSDHRAYGKRKPMRKPDQLDKDLELIRLGRIIGFYLSPPSVLDPARGLFIR